MYEWFLRVHIAFGAAALVTFWLQLPTRKSGLRHRRVGQVYLLAMSGVVVTAIPMTFSFLLKGQWGAGLFLAFLAWITTVAGVSAWTAIRWRNRRLALQQRVAKFCSWVLLLISVSMLLAFKVGGVLFLGLGAFGTWAAIADLRLPSDALVWRSWLARHIEAILGTGIAVHVAFLAFGLGRVFGDAYTNVHFLLAFAVPMVGGMFLSSWFTKKYVGEVATARPMVANDPEPEISLPGSSS